MFRFEHRRQFGRAKVLVVALVTYLITRPALALFREDGHHTSQMIPKGAIVSVDEKPCNPNKLVEVVWGGKNVMMFVEDLRTRGELLDAA